MKNRTKFLIFHSLVAIFYIYMYASSVFNIDYKFSLIDHGKFGFYMSILIILVFILFHKTLISKFKHYFNFKKGKLPFKVFKLSVVLMILHFTFSVASGLLMRIGVNTYQFHALSKYIVPGILAFHLLSNIYRKFSMRSH